MKYLYPLKIAQQVQMKKKLSTLQQKYCQDNVFDITDKCLNLLFSSGHTEDNTGGKWCLFSILQKISFNQ